MPEGNALSGPAKSGAGATENILTSKLGPLPVWAWGGGAVVGALILFKVLGGKPTGTAAQQAAAAYANQPAVPGSNAPGGSPTMGGTPVYVYSQPGQNAQTGGPQGTSVGNLGPGPTSPLAVGTSGTSSLGVTTSTTGVNAGTPGGSSAAGGGLIAFDPNGSQIPVWGLDQAHQGVIGYVPTGTNLGTNVVQRIGYNGDHGWQIMFGGQPGWVASQFTQQQPGVPLGSGGGGGRGRGPRNIPIGNGMVTAGIGRGSGAARISRSRTAGGVHVHRGI